MVAVLVLMGWAWTFPKVRLFANVMIGLWVVDRLAANTLPPNLMMLYFTYVYTICLVTLLAFHWGTISIVVASMFSITAIACGLGSFGYLSWDITGSIQESAGVIAMIFILWRRSNGNSSPVSGSHMAPNRLERGFVGSVGHENHADT